MGVRTKREISFNSTHTHTEEIQNKGVQSLLFYRAYNIHVTVNVMLPWEAQKPCFTFQLNLSFFCKMQVTLS